jgi:hypothetical protein
MELFCTFELERIHAVHSTLTRVYRMYESICPERTRQGLPTKFSGYVSELHFNASLLLEEYKTLIILKLAMCKLVLILT